MRRTYTIRDGDTVFGKITLCTPVEKETRDGEKRLFWRLLIRTGAGEEPIEYFYLDRPRYGPEGLVGNIRYDLPHHISSWGIHHCSQQLMEFVRGVRDQYHPPQVPSA